MQGGAKGPGIFFILPCIDAYARVDLRTRTYDVPPQEVSSSYWEEIFEFYNCMRKTSSYMKTDFTAFRFLFVEKVLILRGFLERSRLIFKAVIFRII